MNLKIGLYAFCAQQMLMDRNTCVITIIKDICVSKCGRNFLKTRRYDSVLSPLFLFFNLIKTVAKFMRTESVKCPAHAVSQARAYYVTQFTYKSEKPTDLKTYAAISNAHLSRVCKRGKLSGSCLSTLNGFGSTQLPIFLCHIGVPTFSSQKKLIKVCSKYLLTSFQN